MGMLHWRAMPSGWCKLCQCEVPVGGRPQHRAGENHRRRAAYKCAESARGRRDEIARFVAEREAMRRAAFHELLLGIVAVRARSEHGSVEGARGVVGWLVAAAREGHVLMELVAEHVDL